MKNVVIVNFPEVSSQSRAMPTSEVVYYFVNNGLSQIASANIRSLFDGYKAFEKEVQLFEYGQRTPTGKVVQDILTFALNDPDIYSISYFDSLADGGLTDIALNLTKTKGFVVLGKNDMIETGMASSLEAKKLFDGTRIPVYEAFTSQKFIENGLAITPAFTVKPPFVFNLDIFRRAMVIPQVAAATQTAFIEAFNPQREADFELFFGYLYNVFVRTIPNNNNILSF